MGVPIRDDPVGSRNKPVVVAPRYRLEPPWACFVERKGADPDDVAFWVDRRDLQIASSKDAKRIYGRGFEEAANTNWCRPLKDDRPTVQLNCSLDLALERRSDAQAQVAERKSALW